MPTLHLVAERGGQFESRHAIHAVAVAADGRVLHRFGDPIVTTWRSAAKPFQLEVSLGLLPAAEIAALRDEEVAVGASSHHAEDGHVATVAGILARFGCTEDDLFCGAHAPGHDEAAAALIRAGQPPTAIHNNCSGKHAFMAASARHHGWPRDYRPPDHPLQERIRDNVAARTGGLVTHVIDGCGVPCFVLSIDAMARAWATLADETARGTGALGRIGTAMHRCWWHASGTTAVDGHLMRTATRPFVAKVGAEGLLCMALPDAAAGIVVKVATGSDKARAVAVHTVLDRWFPGLLPPGSDAPWRTIRNWVGTPCGAWVDEVA